MKRILSISIAIVIMISLIPTFVSAAETDDSGWLELSGQEATCETAGHVWSEWSLLVAPTETEPGMESRTCSRCGESEIRTSGFTWEEYLAQTDQLFSDVSHTDYFYDAVNWAVENGITMGTSDTVFNPYGTCTRGQAVTFLWRACGSEKATGAANPFMDVKKGSYCYDAVLWAYSNNITKGITDTLFEPDSCCDRGQIVTFLWRSAGEPTANDSGVFTDVGTSAYYYAPVKWAVENGITNGTSVTLFSPEAPCSRGQVVTFLYRKSFLPEFRQMTGQEFIDAVAGYVQKYAGSYGIKVHSPVIAQAILESGWGKSSLSKLYHNYFGLKCGSKWTGKYVTLKTKEEYTQGTITTIYANFRVYDSMEDGIRGYFEFIQLSRYANLKGITDPQQYLETIRGDGYATSYSYVESCMKLIEQYNLTAYDPA